MSGRCQDREGLEEEEEEETGGRRRRLVEEVDEFFCSRASRRPTMNERLTGSLTPRDNATNGLGDVSL